MMSNEYQAAGQTREKTQRTPNERLRAQRLRRNWTQVYVATMIGTSDIEVSRWETGAAAPTLYFREQLCTLFGTTPEDLGLASPLETEQEASEQAASPWNVPYRRNPFFTGREEVLTRLHRLLSTGKAAALTQVQAISGLGGIGKTQVAIEYAYRHRDDYSAVFWVKADTSEALTSDFAALASLLYLPEQNDQDQNRAIAAVKRWLKTHPNWLLILDNVEDVNMVSDFLSTETGYLLLTTRSQVSGPFAQCLDLEQMQPEEGALFLLRRSKIIGPDAPLEEAPAADLGTAKAISVLLGGLPLALDQAGAYIEETACSLSGYVERFQAQQATLLKRRGYLATDHSASVSTTLFLSFAKVQQINPAAADLLRLCAFLAPDAIPEEFIIEGAFELGPDLEPIATDRIALDDALAALRRYSLLRRNPDTKTLTIHRLVQAVLKGRMDEDTQCVWAERAVRVVNRAFPDITVNEWAPCSRCQSCLPHAKICSALIEQWSMVFPEARRLLHLTGVYLQLRAQYTQAELLLKKSLDMAVQALGQEHLEVANMLSGLAELYYTQGKYTQAEQLHQQALNIQEKLLGPEHPDVAQTLNDLAVLYRARSQYVQSEQLHQRVLAIREQVLGPEHRSVGMSYNNLSVVYRAQGKYAKAEFFCQRGLEIREKALGPEHPEVAISLSNLGAIYADQGKYKQAEAAQLRAIAIREKSLGPRHPELAISLHHLAILYYKQGNYAQAELLFQRARAIWENTLGPEHPRLAQNLNDLAILYRAQGRYREAEPLFQQALDIREKILGSDHLDVVNSLNSLGQCYMEQGQYEQAEPLFKRALVTLEKVQRLEHPEVATLLENYATLLSATKREAEAAKLAQQAEEIRAKYVRQNVAL